MTINEAKKVIGIEAEKLSDDELMQEIETAELMKNFFFKSLLEHKLPSINNKKTIS